jgi:3-methyladenine DNA glycosylase AlkD
MKKPADQARDSADVAASVAETLAWLKETGRESVRKGMARFAIPSDKALGVPVGELRTFAKALGKDPSLSDALWATDVYEARLLACFTAIPARITSTQMDRWCSNFDNWAICDTACFDLFDRTPHALAKVGKWAKLSGEFQKRAAFALLASVALHDKRVPDATFLETFPILEAAAADDRNFVRKAVNWALRAIGSRNPALHAAALEFGGRLATSEVKAARWIGKDAVRQLHSPATLKRVSR